MVKFLPLGGAGEIGASCFYLNINNCGVILDCGMHPQKTGVAALPRFELINERPVDYVLISHAHQDHLSALPYLVQRHPYIKVISTPQTRALAELTLHDSVSILKEQITDEDDIKIYSHEEVDLLVRSMNYKSYKENFFLNGYSSQSNQKINAQFYDAGHILGSAGILLEFNGKRFFYTGDINLDKQSLTLGAELPEGKIDTLILETTYGATDSSSLFDWEVEVMKFADKANKILNAGGSILIPVFSLGKMQEILYTIWKLMGNNKLTRTDIYTGGLAKKISRVYDYNRFVVTRIDKNFELKSIPQLNLYEVEKIDDFFKHPCIVLASSGMLIEGTASFRLAKRWIKQANSAVFVVGYMEDNTPGYTLINSNKGDKIKFSDFDNEEKILCSIEQFRFSSHSRREELVEIVKKLKPDNVVLIHGDSSAIDWVGAHILRNFKKTKVYAAERGKEIILE